MDIHRTYTKDYILPSVKKVVIVDYYKGIRSLLEARLGMEFSFFLAQPRQRTDVEIVWSTGLNYGTPVPLSEMKSPEKDTYVRLLKNRIKKMEELIRQLKSEGVESSTTDMLSKVISYISDNCVYCIDGDVVVVNWGMIPRTASPSGAIYRGGQFFGDWSAADVEHEDVTSGTQDSTDIQQSTTDDISTAVIDAQPSSTEPKPSDPFIGEETPQYPPSVKEDNVSQESVTEEPAPDTDTRDTEEKKQEEDVLPPISPFRNDEPVERVNYTGETQRENQEKPTTNVVDNNNRESKKESDSWGSFFKGLWSGLLFLLRKSWWLLLLLLLLLLTLFCFKECQGPISRVNPFYNPLPTDPQLLPINEENIGLSVDSFSVIVTDRLNVMFDEGTTLDEMRQWGRDFKKIYTSSQYYIFYYNEELSTLQIKVPTDERDKVLHELNAQMPEYSFMVFEESVMSSNFVSNDPAYYDEQKSWFFKAINAEEAWKYTMGIPSVVVAVIDNGFDLGHEELVGKIVAPYNAFEKNNHVYPVIIKGEKHDHGTHVSSTAVGNVSNGKGLLGVAPLCKLMPIQAGMDYNWSLSHQAIIDGVLYAVNHGASVVNMSLGQRFSEREMAMTPYEQLNYINSSYKEEELEWERVVKKAKAKNCIIVKAAGNDNLIAGMDPQNRSKDIIVVSAVSTNLKKSDFSNYGRFPSMGKDYSHLSAPGEQIYGAAPDGSYNFARGTSYATPVVSGAVAILRSLDGSLTVERAKSILQKSGVVVDPSIGPLINLGKAVEELQNGGNCDMIHRRIDQLRREIDSLEHLCPTTSTDTVSSDTVKYEDVSKDVKALNGKWKSTTEIFRSTDGAPVVLYFTFKDGNGKLSIVCDGVNHEARLTASSSDGRVSITQHEEACNKDKSVCFNRYQYQCSADKKGNLKCVATNSSSKVAFSLIKVK